MTIRALGQAGFRQKIMSATSSPALGGMSTFRIRHDSIPLILLDRDGLQVSQPGPPVIHRFLVAVALDLVPVLPANRTDSFAVLAAYALHRQLQDNLLAHHVGQFQPLALVET